MGHTQGKVGICGSCLQSSATLLVLPCCSALASAEVRGSLHQWVTSLQACFPTLLALCTVRIHQNLVNESRDGKGERGVLGDMFQAALSLENSASVSEAGGKDLSSLA